MLSWFARAYLKRMGARYDYDVSYMLAMLEASPKAFFRFAKLHPLAQHRESVTAVFIECSKCEVRLPAGVTLPPLANAPVAQPNGQPGTFDNSKVEPAVAAPSDGAYRISRDEARELKQRAQHAFGYREGERRLRQDLGFEPDESLTLRHLAAHVTVAQYTTLRATYEAALREAVEADVP